MLNYHSLHKFVLAVFLFIGSNTLAGQGVTLSVDTIRYVYDGDTFYIDCVPEFKCVNGKLGIRALGLDTPEIKGECTKEKRMARLAKQHLVQLKNQSEYYLVEPDSKRPYDRYNRLLAKVSFNGVDWAESMINANLGRVWTGSRGGWCN